MHKKGFYKNLNPNAVVQKIRREGFVPVLFQHGPGYRYSPHSHREEKLLAFLEGSMRVRAGKKWYTCKPGDKLIIAGGTEHEAVVGSKGCVFFWAER